MSGEGLVPEPADEVAAPGEQGAAGGAAGGRGRARRLARQHRLLRGRGGPPQRGRGRGGGGGGRQPGACPRGLHRRQGRAVIEWRFSINSCYSYYI